MPCELEPLVVLSCLRVEMRYGGVVQQKHPFRLSLFAVQSVAARSPESCLVSRLFVFRFRSFTRKRQS